MGQLVPTKAFRTAWSTVRVLIGSTLSPPNGLMPPHGWKRGEKRHSHKRIPLRSSYDMRSCAVLYCYQLTHLGQRCLFLRWWIHLWRYSCPAIGFQLWDSQSKQYFGTYKLFSSLLYSSRSLCLSPPWLVRLLLMFSLLSEYYMLLYKGTG